MVFRKESVLERLKHLEEVLSALETKASVTLETYEKDRDIQWFVEKYYL